jgi:hypothetical protein
MNTLKVLQNIYIMEKDFVGKWNCGMLVEFCWSVVRETPENGFKIDQEKHSKVVRM